MGIFNKYDENRPVKEYGNFCKKLKFIEGEEITVKINQKFAAKYSANFTVPPEYQGSIPEVNEYPEEIELIDDRSFYPYPYGFSGGDTIHIYVFKAKKKGTFKIKIGSQEINVNAI